MSIFGDVKAGYARRSETRLGKKLEKQEQRLVAQRVKRRDVGKRVEATGKLRAEKKQLSQLKRAERIHKLEGWEERHPGVGESIGYAKTAAGKATRFAGFLAEEGAKSYGQMSSRMSKKVRRKSPTIRAKSRTSFIAPEGTDISLSAGIAANDWAGERNIMSTDFFGEREQPDLLGNTRDKQWNMDIFGESNGYKKDVDFIGSERKKKNQNYF